MNEYVNIGKVVAAFGLAGELVIRHALGKKTAFKAGNAIFIEELKGSYLPYFIQTSRAKNTEETFVLLDGVAAREKAKSLLQKQVWLLQNDFRKLVARDSPLGLLGYTVIQGDTLIGIIDEVIEQPHQVLLQIQIEGKEVLIPLHHETLEKINHGKREVHVILPEGLLDVYL